MLEFDVAVIGGGIVGLSLAREAAQRGQRVVIVERSRLAQGASIRNFGMIWPIGQPAGELYHRAVESRRIWLEIYQQAGIWLRECGSRHVVYQPEELAVIQEFAAKARQLEIACELLSPAETVARYPAVQPSGLLGALFSPTELAVDPPQAIQRLPNWLAEQYGVTLLFGQTAVSVEMPRVRLASGDLLRAERVFVCSGSDFETLFPQHYATQGLKRCKLQMMRTRPQPNGWRIGTHLAGGLTLGHYKSFEICESLPAMRARHAADYPDHLRLGIHVMASQNAQNEVIIGDSHEYDDDISPFDNLHIDDLILKYLRKMVQLPEWELSARWHGIYAKYLGKSFYSAQPQPHCYIVNAPGGAGMTLSFGTAAYLWRELDAGRWPE